MKLTKPLFAKFAGLALSVATLPAQAIIVSYDFTAKIDSLFEHDAATKVNTTVQSSTFTGRLISTSDAVFGKFTYDTNAPLSPYYQPDPPVTGTYLLYQSPAPISGIELNFGIGPAGFISSSGALVQIANDASNFSGWDIFHISAYTGYDPTWSQDAHVSLFDKSASVFQAGTLPSALSLDSFSYKQVGTGWVRKSDGNQLQLGATLTSLTPTPVPEPSAYALLLAGLAGIGMAQVRRQRHGARKL